MSRAIRDKRTPNWFSIHESAAITTIDARGVFWVDAGENTAEITRADELCRTQP